MKAISLSTADWTQGRPRPVQLVCQQGGAATDWAEGRPRPAQLVCQQGGAATDWAEGRPRPVQLVCQQGGAATDWGEGRPRPVHPDGVLSFMVYADSAIGRDVQPLFIPDIAPRWLCHVCLTVRIGRLGKCIAERFADRYIDALGLVALISPVDADAINPPGLLSIMDSAITTGRWAERAVNEDLSTKSTGDGGWLAAPLTINVTVEGRVGSTAEPNSQSPQIDPSSLESQSLQIAPSSLGSQSLQIDPTSIGIPRLISFVSRASTLKTGDLLILRDTAITLPLVTNTWIHASLTGSVTLPDALRIKVK